jgi:hypothetical protein
MRFIPYIGCIEIEFPKLLNKDGWTLLMHFEIINNSAFGIVILETICRIFHSYEFTLSAVYCQYASLATLCATVLPLAVI